MTERPAGHLVRPCLAAQKGYAYNSGMKIGYARVSTDEQNLDLQLQALAAAGCGEVFQDRLSWCVTSARPGLLAALERVQEGDTLTVWRIDRLGRSTLHLLQILDQLRSRAGRTSPARSVSIPQRCGGCS